MTETHIKEKLWTKNFILLIVASLGSGFLVSLFLNTLPIYAEQMSGTAVYAGLVTTCYSMAALATRPVVGILCEKVSSLKLIVAGLALMTLSCYMYSFASVIGLLLFIRVLHGIGFGIKSTASGVLAAELIPKSRFAEGIGMFGLYLPVANAIGPAFGLWIAEKGSFSSLFTIAGIIGVVSVVLMLLIRRKPAADSSDDAKAEEPAVIMDETIPPPKSFLGFEFGVVFPSLTLMLMYFGYSAIISFVALYAKDNDIKGIGLFFSISAIALFIFRFFFAKLVKKYGYHIFVIISMTGFAVVLMLIPHMHNIIYLYILSVFYGAALGIVPMAVNAQVMERCTPRRRGTAMAAYTSSMDIGICIGSTVLAFIIEASGFTAAFSTAGIVSIIGVVLYALTVARDHNAYLERMAKYYKEI